MIEKVLGDITFWLNRDFDFTFLAQFGVPFVVFDQQDSGNLCFGVRDGEQKLFIKLAGAETVRSHITPEEAMERLWSTIPVYQDLAHPNLTRLLCSHEIDGGRLLVFEWFDGTCMGKQYGSFDRFLKLPIASKMEIYRCILEFHRHVNEHGYIAIDFYDGAIMYNFETRQTMICDIEFYRKKPVINNMGRMWGSGRFMSPEEFEMGAEIDERSNVFCMGAAAFQLFGGGVERLREEWGAPEALYRVVRQATSPDRADRFQSIGAYMAAWNAALT